MFPGTYTMPTETEKARRTAGLAARYRRSMLTYVAPEASKTSIEHPGFDRCCETPVCR